jgi:hypothetical protein
MATQNINGVIVLINIPMQQQLQLKFDNFQIAEEFIKNCNCVGLAACRQDSRTIFISIVPGTVYTIMPLNEFEKYRTCTFCGGA